MKFEIGDMCIYNKTKNIDSVGIIIAIHKTKSTIMSFTNRNSNGITFKNYDTSSIDVVKNILPVFNPISNKLIKEFSNEHFYDPEYSLNDVYMTFKSCFYDYLFATKRVEIEEIQDMYPLLNNFVDRNIFFYKYNVLYHFNVDLPLFDNITTFVNYTKSYLFYINHNMK